MSLARMEAQVAIGKLVQRFETLEHGGEFLAAAEPVSAAFSAIPCAWPN